jgi:hypothetical protein
MGDRRWVVIRWCVERCLGLVLRIVDLLLIWFQSAAVRRFPETVRGLLV